MTEPTPRQLLVLVTWIEEGSTEKAALRLHMHPSSVRNVLGDLRAVLGATNSVQAFAIAVRAGLVDPHKLDLPDAA